MVHALGGDGLHLEQRPQRSRKQAVLYEAGPAPSPAVLHMLDREAKASDAALGCCPGGWASASSASDDTVSPSSASSDVDVDATEPSETWRHAPAPVAAAAFRMAITSGRMGSRAATTSAAAPVPFATPAPTAAGPSILAPGRGSWMCTATSCDNRVNDGTSSICSNPKCLRDRAKFGIDTTSKRQRLPGNSRSVTETASTSATDAAAVAPADHVVLERRLRPFVPYAHKVVCFPLTQLMLPDDRMSDFDFKEDSMQGNFLRRRPSDGFMCLVVPPGAERTRDPTSERVVARAFGVCRRDEVTLWHVSARKHPWNDSKGGARWGIFGIERRRTPAGDTYFHQAGGGPRLTDRNYDRHVQGTPNPYAAAAVVGLCQRLKATRAIVNPLSPCANPFRAGEPHRHSPAASLLLRALGFVRSLLRDEVSTYFLDDCSRLGANVASMHEQMGAGDPVVVADAVEAASASASAVVPVAPFAAPSLAVSRSLPFALPSLAVSQSLLPDTFLAPIPPEAHFYASSEDEDEATDDGPPPPQVALAEPVHVRKRRGLGL